MLTKNNIKRLNVQSYNKQKLNAYP